MKRKARAALFIVGLASLAAASAAVAQPSPAAGADVTIGRREVLHSNVLGEDRPILIALPPPPSPFAPPGPRAKYPVMVLLDADWSFEHTVAAARFLAGNGLLPPMIVVGVVNVDRGRDMMPTFAGRDLVEGPSDRFLSFLCDELVPHVEKTHPALPYRLIVGHSNGGMFSLFALVRRPGFFAAHLAMSPSFGQDDRFVGALERMLASRPRLDAFVYVSSGEEEADVAVGAVRFAKALETTSPAGLETRYAYFPGESHGSVAHKAVYRGLELLGYADGLPPAGAAAFLPKSELRRRAWTRRFGADFGGPRVPQASVAAPLLRLLDTTSGRAELGAQHESLKATEKASFRFDALELRNLEAWLRAAGRAADADAVRALGGPDGPAAGEDRGNEYGARVDLARGLVARYPLDGDACEAAGRGTEGKIEGAVPAPDRRGRASGALRFDGRARVVIPSPPRLATGGSFTVSAWVRPSGRTAYAAWVSKATRPYGSQWRAGFASSADEQWGLTVFNGRWTDYWIARAPVPDGQWSHVVVTADETIGRLRYYVNGAPAGGSDTLEPLLASDAPLYVGFQQDDGVHYTGDVDDLRLWDRTLSPAEVAALHAEE